MDGIKDIQHNEIEKRKELIRRVWEYKKVDHIPIFIGFDDLSKYTLREQCENGQIQFEINVNRINRCLKNIPDDYIPYARIWPGYITIGSMFGIQPHSGVMI